MIWIILDTLMVESLNIFTIMVNCPTHRSVLSLHLLQKKKDRSDIANWRPISLIDVKIGSETITKRLETVLPSIIYHNQCAYVKDRTISDAARSLATNVLISKIGKISSPAWSFRGDAEESLQLIFAPCPFTKKL